jgi:hypothetical protein
VFILFAFIGFSVGYFSNKTDVDDIMSNAFREHRITAVNSSTIKYSGETVVFTYDVDSDKLKVEKEDANIFDNISFEKVTMAISIPIAFKNLFKTAKYSGNSRTKAAFIVAGSIGILCGYSIGKPIGENYALWRSERSLEEYFSRDAVQNKVKRELKEIYQ